WDGESWHAFGKGLSAGAVTMAFWRGDLFVGGDFGVAGNQQAPFIARWNHSQWSGLHQGSTDCVVGKITALAANQDKVLAVGWINSAGNLPMQNSAFWDGAEWSFGGFLQPPQVNYFSAAAVGSDFYVAGNFRIA